MACLPLLKLYVENISLPPEVEAALDAYFVDRFARMRNAPAGK
jgi:hypothetical protein